jgi:signal transduction histidine kinase
MSIDFGTPKGAVATLFSLVLTLSGVSRISAQPVKDDRILDNDRVLIKTYQEDDENAVDGVNDFFLDSTGILWLAPVLYNISSFDGNAFRLLHTPKAGKKPVLSFSHIEKDEHGKLFFTSDDLRYYLRLDRNGQLAFDSTLSANNNFAHNRYPYFNWDRFLGSAATAEIRVMREGLKSRVSQSKSFRPLNDSSFLFDENDISYLYKDSKLSIFVNRKAMGGKPVLVHDELVLVDKNKLMAVDEQSWTSREIALTGDLLRDKSGAQSLVALVNCHHPHLTYDNKLYRLVVVNKYEFKTVFVCDLSFLHYAINKVEYYPADDLTILASQGEGLVLIRPNSFYPAAFSPQFRELKKTRIYYPVAVKEKNSFLTSWGEFAGKGYFKSLASRPEGPRCLFIDHAGNVWVGIRNKIVLCDSDMRKLNEVSVSAEENEVVDFAEDEKGDILCLTDHSIHVFKDGRFENNTRCENCVPGKETFDNIVYMGDETFWIGSDNGLYLYDRRHNSVKKQPSVADAPIICIKKLKDGSVLFSAYQQDFNGYYYNGQFYKLPVGGQDGLKELMSIEEDTHGKIWLSTNKGLFVTTRSALQDYCKGLTTSIFYYKYDKTDGLSSVEFNGGLNASSAATASGYFAFNSMDGPVVFHQDSVKQYFPDHGFLIDGDSIISGRGNNNILFRVVVPYYHNKANLHVEFKIAGVQDTWTEVTPDGKILINHLPHGSHLLSIRVRTGFGLDDFFTKEVHISVDPLFYETVFFKICLSILLLLIVLFVIVTTLRLQSRKKEIKLKNARLQENIELKERLISLILHDLKTPLYFQSLLFNQVNRPDFFDTEEGRSLFIELKNSNTAILKFTKDFLTWYSSQEDGFVVRKTEFEQTRLIDDVLSVYSEIAASKKLRLIYDKGEPVRLFTDRNILEIILRNILDNAIKYTAAGHVGLFVERQPGVITITVADTGNGMTTEKVRILEEYSNKLHSQSSETFGYRFIFTLAEKIEARIRIRSELGKGTNVTISIPDEARPGQI